MGKLVAGLRKIDEEEFITRLGEFMCFWRIHPDEIVGHEPFKGFLNEPQQYNPEAIYGWNPGDLYLDWTAKHFTGLHLSLSKKRITFRDCPTGTFDMHTRAEHVVEELDKWVSEANHMIGKFNRRPRPIFPKFPAKAYYDKYSVGRDIFIHNFAGILKPFHHNNMTLHNHFIELDGVHVLWSAYISYEGFDYLIGRRVVMQISYVNTDEMLKELMDQVLNLTYKWNEV